MSRTDFFLERVGRDPPVGQWSRYVGNGETALVHPVLPG